MKKLIIILAAIISVSAVSAQGYTRNGNHDIAQKEVTRQQQNENSRQYQDDRKSNTGNQVHYQQETRTFNNRFDRRDHDQYNNDRNYNAGYGFERNDKFENRQRSEHPQAGTLGKILITGAIAGVVAGVLFSH